MTNYSNDRDNDDTNEWDWAVLSRGTGYSHFVKKSHQMHVIELQR